MAMMLISKIPVIGWIMVLVWAFSGENKTRKNYYRAILAWFLIGMALFAGFVFITGSPTWPAIEKHIHDWVLKIRAMV